MNTGVGPVDAAARLHRGHPVPNLRPAQVVVVSGPAGQATRQLGALRQGTPGTPGRAAAPFPRFPEPARPARRGRHGGFDGHWPLYLASRVGRRVRASGPGGAGIGARRQLHLRKRAVGERLAGFPRPCNPPQRRRERCQWAVPRATALSRSNGVSRTRPWVSVVDVSTQVA